MPWLPAFDRQDQGLFASRPILVPSRVGIIGDNGIEPLAQYRFDGIFPAGFNVQRFPQRLVSLQMIAPQPFAQFPVTLYAFLQLFERGAARLCLGALFLSMLHVRQHLTALLFKAG